MAQEVDPLARAGDRRQLVERQPHRVGTLFGQGQEQRAVEREVEERLQLVAAAEVVGQDAEVDVDFAE